MFLVINCPGPKFLKRIASIFAYDTALSSFSPNETGRFAIFYYLFGDTLLPACALLS
tara:strand:- start:105 stop:275 length:171 start_codon:yes stop_codon:yes gene_type:complete